MSFPNGPRGVRRGVVLCRNPQDSKLPNIGHNGRREACTLYVGTANIPPKNDKYWDFRVRPRGNLNLPSIEVSPQDKSNREKLSHKDSGFSEESDEEILEERFNEEESLQIRGFGTKSLDKLDEPKSPRKAKSLILGEESGNIEQNELKYTRSMSCYGQINLANDTPMLCIQKLATRFGDKPVNETPNKIVIRKPYRVPLTGVCTQSSDSLRFEILGLKTPRTAVENKTLMFYPVDNEEAKLPSISKDSIALFKNKRKYLPKQRSVRKEMPTKRITIPTGEGNDINALLIMSRRTSNFTPQLRTPQHSRLDKVESVYSEDEIDEDISDARNAWTRKSCLQQGVFDIKETRDNSPIYGPRQQLPTSSRDVQDERPKSPVLEEGSKQEIFDKCQQWLNRLHVEQTRLSRVDEQVEHVVES